MLVLNAFPYWLKFSCNSTSFLLVLLIRWEPCFFVIRCDPSPGQQFTGEIMGRWVESREWIVTSFIQKSLQHIITLGLSRIASVPKLCGGVTLLWIVAPETRAQVSAHSFESNFFWDYVLIVLTLNGVERLWPQVRGQSPSPWAPAWSCECNREGGIISNFKLTALHKSDYAGNPRLNALHNSEDAANPRLNAHCVWRLTLTLLRGQRIDPAASASARAWNVEKKQARGAHWWGERKKRCERMRRSAERAGVLHGAKGKHCH